MGEQPDQFDLAKGKRLRDEGISQAGANSGRWLDIARATALRIAQVHGQVTSDDVRAILEGQGLYPHHPNAWGAVFKQPHWTPTGERVASRVPSRHANEIRVWKIK
jgi:hypothetical protein